MLLSDVNTGRIELYSFGNVTIKRKNGKKISVPPREELAELIHKYNETKSPEALAELQRWEKNFPKLAEGDTILIGPDSSISLTASYNKGRDRPVEGLHTSVGKTFSCGADSEVAVLGFESWDRSDKTAEKRYFGEALKTIEVRKSGFFYCSYDNCEDEFVTPTAALKFTGLGGAVTGDIYNGALYAVVVKHSGLNGEHGNVNFTSRGSKRTYLAKSELIEEIIVTGNAIYRRPFDKMDQINYMIGPQLAAMAMQAGFTAQDMDASSMAKDIGKTSENAMTSMEMLKGLKPEELEKLLKIGGATPEQISQMKDLPEKLKRMDKDMPMDKLYSAMAQTKAFYEGMGDTGAASMAKLQKQAQLQAKTQIESVMKQLKDSSSAPRKYGPLTSDLKVA